MQLLRRYRMAGMKYRKLRIAWSVAWGVLCIALIALWVRSYAYGFVVSRQANEVQSKIVSASGLVSFIRLDYFDKEGPWKLRQAELGDIQNNQELWFPSFEQQSWYFALHIPYWVLFLSLGLFGVMPWLHFSLRTLLIVTTFSDIDSRPDFPREHFYRQQTTFGFVADRISD